MREREGVSEREGGREGMRVREIKKDNLTTQYMCTFVHTHMYKHTYTCMYTHTHLYTIGAHTRKLLDLHKSKQGNTTNLNNSYPIEN